MNKLEPTYLRYVYDELGRGSLSSDNASSLPHGFIGLFEKEFSSDIPISQRSSTLRRLCLWALLKKAVSSEFVSEVLKENTDSTKALIDTYSKWFNSPEPGKYVLFHDRLRSYLIQKLSDHEVQEINEQLIAYLEQSLESSVGEESELYALEHLSTHMAVESQLENNYKRLHAFVNREDLWPRQVRASKEYKWSQKAIQYGIKEGARRHDEMDSLNSTINSIFLNRLEQKDYKQIIEFYENDEFDLVLFRIKNLELKNQILMIFNLLFRLTHSNLQNLQINKEYASNLVNLLNDITRDNEVDFSKFCSQIQIYFVYLKLKNLNIDLSYIWDGRSNYEINKMLEIDDVFYNPDDIFELLTLSKPNDVILSINKIFKYFIEKNEFDQFKKTYLRFENYLEKFKDKLIPLIVKYVNSEWGSKPTEFINLIKVINILSESKSSKIKIFSKKYLLLNLNFGEEIVDYHKKIIFFNSLTSELSSSALLVHEKLLISKYLNLFLNTKFSEEYIGDAFLELKSLIDKTFKYNIETELFNVVDENRLRIIKDKVKEKLEFISNEDETGLESNDKSFEEFNSQLKKISTKDWKDNYEDFFTLYKESFEHNDFKEDKFELLFKGIQGYKYSLYSGDIQEPTQSLYLNKFPQLSFELSKMSCLLSGISFDFQRLLNSVIDAKQFNIAFNLLTKMNNENDQFFCDESMRFIPTLRLIHNLILNKNLSKVIQLISCFENKIIRIDLFLETYILLSNNNDDSSLNKISSLITLDISHIKFKNYLYRLVLHKTNNIEKKEHINHLFSIVENFKASEISKASLNNKSTFDDSYDKIFNNYDSREYNKELEKDLINHNSKLKDELDLFFKSSEELPEKVDRGISLIYNKIFDIDLELANKVFEKTIKIISEYTFDEPNRCSSLKDYINNSIIKNNPDYILDAAKLITNAGNTYFNIFKFFAQNEDFESCMKTSSKLFFFEIDFKNNLEIQDKYFDSLIKLFDSNKDLTLKIIKNTNHNGYVITSYCPKKYNSNNVKYYNNSIWIQKIYCRLAIYLIKTQNDYISFYKLLDLIDDLEIKNECLKDAIDLVTIFGDKNSVFQLMDKQFIFKNKKINDNLIVENYFLSKIETINNQEIFTLINKTNDDDLNLYNQKRNKTIDNLIYKLIKYPKNYSLVYDLALNKGDIEVSDSLSELSILYSRKKMFDYSLRILDLLPEDNFMLNKFIKSETIKEISIEMVRAGFLSKALKIINYSNEDQIKNKIYHKILIEYINNFSLYGVDKLEYNINLIKNDWLNIDENNRPYNETILSLSIIPMIDSYIKIKEKKKNSIVAEKLFLLSKKLINNDNIFIIDKVSSLLKVSIFFKTNYSKFYKKTVDELKLSITKLDNFYNETSLNNRIKDILSVEHDIKYRRVWSELNAFKDHLLIKIEFFILTTTVSDNEIESILKNLLLLKNYCIEIEEKPDFKGRFFRESEYIEEAYDIEPDHHLRFSSIVASKLLIYFSSTNSNENINKVYSDFYSNPGHSLTALISPKPIYYESISKRKKIRIDRLKRLKDINAPDVILNHENKMLYDSIIKSTNYLYASLEHFKEYNSSVLFSFFENKMKEDLNTINNQLSYISNKASTYIYFYLAKFYIDIEYAKSLNYSKRIYDEKLFAAYVLEVYNKRDLVDAITLMNKNNISNIDNILSKEISILLFENEIKANNPFIYLSNFNKDVFSLEKLLENKIYFEIFNNKISKNKICSYEKLFDISILKDMI